MVGKACGNQQITPIGLRQPNRLLKLAPIATAQLECGEADTLHLRFVFALTKRKVVSALFLQQGTRLFPAIRRKEERDSQFGFGA